MAKKPVAAGAVGNTSTWVMITGAFFGGLTLLGFMAFAYLAADNRNFLCNSYDLLAPVFALGTGLASAFLGGAAVVKGKFNIAGLTSPIAVGLGGGIAATLVSFFVFNHNSPNCSSGQVFSIEGIPSTFTAAVEERYWTRRAYDPFLDKYTFAVLLEQQTAEIQIGITQDRKEKCRVHLVLTNNIGDEQRSREDQYTFLSKGGLTTFAMQYDDARPIADTTKESVAHCVKWRATPVYDLVIISVPEKQIAVAKSIRGLSGDETDDESSELDRDHNFSMIASAYAQVPPMPFPELSKLLHSSDDATRVAARRYLSSNFPQYAKDVLASLVAADTEPSPPFIADLLSGLASGVSQQDPRMAPGQGVKPGKPRDFSVLLPFIDGNEKLIIDLAADPDPRVKKQARRVIQRYPFDKFKAIYDQLTDAVPAICPTNQLDERQQALLYSSIFFYYNRIVDFNYAPTLTSAALADARNSATRGLAAAKCLRRDLQIDGAVIHFGLALILAEDKGNPKLVEAGIEAKKFLDYVAADETGYYLQSHVEEMRALAAKSGAT